MYRVLLEVERNRLALVADYSAQAVINTILSHAFPSDPIIGEEDSTDLRTSTSPSSALLRERITELANGALRDELGYGDVSEWGIGPSWKERTTDELLDAIDRGNFEGGPSGRECSFAL